MFGESVFHNCGQIEDNGLRDEGVFVDLGNDRMGNIEDELRKGIAEAVDNGLFKRVRRSLKNPYKVPSRSSKYDLVVDVQSAIRQ